MAALGAGLVLVASLVASVFLYPDDRTFSVWVSQRLNAGSDDLGVGECAAPIGGGHVELPCAAAAAVFTVRAEFPRPPGTRPSSRDPRDVCSGVQEWDWGTDAMAEGPGHFACLDRKGY